MLLQDLQPMSHLKINSYVGPSFLTNHSPIHCYLFNKRAISVGTEGDLIMWLNDSKSLTPLFVLLPTINHQAGSLVSLGVLNCITSLFESYPSYKTVTLHQDNRLRVWNWDDGICTTTSPIGLFQNPLKGVCSDMGETKTVVVYSETCIYGIDLWKMNVVFRVKIEGNIRVVVKEHKRIVFQDTIRRILEMDVTEITKEKWNEPIGLLIGNQENTNDEMKSAFRKFEAQVKVKDSEDIAMPEEYILPSEDGLRLVEEYITQASRGHQMDSLLSSDFKKEYPELVQQLKQESITQSCLLFVNNEIPYFFFGCQSGRLIGVPLLMNPSKFRTVIFESECSSKEVRFLDSGKNLLFCSLSNEKLLIYSLANIETCVQNQSKPCPGLSSLVKIPFQKFLLLSDFLSSPIKYKLHSYSCIRTEILPEDNLECFELENKQVVVYNFKDKSLSSLKGFTQENRILAVMAMDYYMGVVHSQGISIFKPNWCFERLISYDNWEWRNYSMENQSHFKPDYHNYYNLRKENPSISLVDYSLRYLPYMLDYLEPNQQLLYQIFGNFNDQKISNDMFPSFYFKNRTSTLSVLYSQHGDNGMGILKMLKNKERRKNWHNTSYIVHTDIRKQLDKIMATNDPINAQQTSLPFIFPYEADEQLSRSVKSIMGGDVTSLRTLYCFQGIGTSLTVYLSNRLGVSSFLTSYQAMSIMDYFITLCTKEGMGDISNVMFRCVELFTKKRPEDFQQLSISSLSQLTVSSSGNIVNTGCNLLISSIVGKELNIGRLETYFLLNLKRLEESRSKLLTSCEICLMLTIGFTYLYSNNTLNNERLDYLINRIINAIDLVNFERVPELVAINMKILNEGMEKWKQFLDANKVYSLLNNLFIVFFLYDGLSSVPRDDRKFNFGLSSASPVLVKRMKQVIIKTIVYVSQNFPSEFMQVLKKEAVNQEIHHMYPSSVIEILRQFIKSQKPNKHLGFYVELLLKCLSPTTPQLRKYVQKNVTQTLHLMCSYKNISFNQPSQKLALVTDNHVFIYDLRTATKWRTIGLDKSTASEYVVEMSPKGSYIAVLADNLRIWRLSNSLWSGVLGAFSQGWTFEDVSGRVIKWDQNEASVTVEADNPANTRAFQL